ncbi:MAG: hypothetical protein ACRDY2_08210 [Acidimicrobiales bacterium]
MNTFEYILLALAVIAGATFAATELSATVHHAVTSFINSTTSALSVVGPNLHMIHAFGAIL